MGFPLPPDKIAATETALGVRFPLEYLARLRRNNGGTLLIGDGDWELFPFRDDTDRKRLARTSNDVVTETRKHRQVPGFPPHGVAIGADGGGNALVLMPSQDDPTRLDEALMDWFHETGELACVADSIADVEEA